LIIQCNSVKIRGETLPINILSGAIAMKLCMNRAIFFIALLLVLLPYPVQAEHKALSVEIERGKAEVTLLEGNAFLEKKDTAKAQDICKGDYLVSGDRVSTDKESRIELKLPDESFIRYRCMQEGDNGRS